MQQRASQSGQGMTEYLIIVALIAITSIGIIGIFGDSLKFQISKSVSFLLGNNKSVVRKPRVTKKASKRRSLKDFEEAAER